MAASAKLFHRRQKTLTISTVHRPATCIHFSSSSPDLPGNDPSPAPPPPPPPPESPSPHYSFISDLKASLKQNQQLRNPQSQPPPHPRKPFSFASSSLPNPPPKASLDEIRKNLQEFRRRSAPPPPPELLNGAGTPPNSAPPISFQTLYARDLAAANNKKAEGSSTSDGPQSVSEMSFMAIKESLINLRAANNEGNRNGRLNSQLSRPNLKLGPSKPFERQSPIVIRGTGSLLSPVLGSESSVAEDGEGKMRTEFFRSYTHKELGEKLRLLRPEKKGDGENWFSLEELNERLAKLREMEVRESKSREVGGVSLFELRESFKKMADESQKSRLNTMLKIGALDELGRTPDYMLAPPQEHLVEKYFHPDNMSESEKLKLELKKVRDEFKMSESDCGSARVQVAQLTTKIKHLAKVLHKKDKHSRKGLNDMIQRRKKLLKYMRRTDWGSYCFVLSKLGLRDNPGYNT